jgi:predicted RNA-binding protein YlxR (DUF448 family)
MVNVPERSCVICRTKKPKKELFRFVSKNGEVLFDESGVCSGRGFYICSKKCWDMAVIKKRRIKISSRANKFIELPDKEFDKAIKIKQYN